MSASGTKESTERRVLLVVALAGFAALVVSMAGGLDATAPVSTAPETAASRFTNPEIALNLYACDPEIVTVEKTRWRGWRVYVHGTGKSLSLRKVFGRNAPVMSKQLDRLGYDSVAGADVFLDC